MSSLLTQLAPYLIGILMFSAGAEIINELVKKHRRDKHIKTKQNNSIASASKNNINQNFNSNFIRKSTQSAT